MRLKIIACKYTVFILVHSLRILNKNRIFARNNF